MSRQKRTAIMCAEAVPWRCHRSLVADALVCAASRRSRFCRRPATACTSSRLSRGWKERRSPIRRSKRHYRCKSYCLISWKMQKTPPLRRGTVRRLQKPARRPAREPRSVVQKTPLEAMSDDFALSFSGPILYASRCGPFYRFWFRIAVVFTGVMRVPLVIHVF